VAAKHSPQEQAALDAAAEQQFGLPPGTLARYFDGRNSLVGLAALAKERGLDAEQIAGILNASDRHADLAPHLGANAGSQKSRISAGDIAKILAVTVGIPVGGIIAGAAGGGAAGGGYTAQQVAQTAASIGGGAGAAASVPSWLQRALGMGSEALGAISEQRAANRAGEIDYDTIRDAAEQRRHSGMLDALRADLDQRRFLSDEYGRNTGRAIHGGLLQGTQDVDIQAPAGIQMGTVSGGLRPSSITGKEDIGRTLQQRAMQELTNPTQPGGVGPDGPTPGRLPNIPNAPDLSPRRERSGLDTGIDLAGLASSIFADIYRVPGATKTAPIPPPPAPAPANTRTPGLLGQNYWNQVRF
jgi:hypothetical protein